MAGAAGAGRSHLPGRWATGFFFFSHAESKPKEYETVFGQSVKSSQSCFRSMSALEDGLSWKCVLGLTNLSSKCRSAHLVGALTPRSLRTFENGYEQYRSRF